MQTIKLKSGNEIPLIGLGTWQMTGQECVETIKKAIDIGYIHIDTAEAYRNQKEIGRALKESGADRSKLFITSKVWLENLKHDDVIEACEQTLSDLGTDYLDLYLVHWPNKSIHMEETFKALNEIYNQGKIKSIGVSNFTIAHLREAMQHAEISMNQIEVHPHFYQDELISFCKDNGIAVTAYSPLGRGDELSDPVLEKIGDNHSKSAAQVCLRWLLQKGLVAIPKSTDDKHLKSNLQMFDWELTEDEMSEIDGLNKGERIIEPDFAEFDRTE
ncbi:aldo/keto reductase [Candidatus Woesearchaeota archaeon]|nr:aldo/keto reductase [Candidatus Woesearchaeota archaeon]